MLQGLPATEKRLQQIQQAQKEDAVCCKLIKYCLEGWPDKNLLPGPIKPYIHVAAELTVQNDLLLRGNRIVIPVSLQIKILEKLTVLIRAYTSVDRGHNNLYGGLD